MTKYIIDCISCSYDLWAWQFFYIFCSVARLSNIHITQSSEAAIIDCISEWPQPAGAEGDPKAKGGTDKGLWGKESWWIVAWVLCVQIKVCSVTLFDDVWFFFIGLSSTLLEKENELSKIQKELKLLEPYKVNKSARRDTVYIFEGSNLAVFAAID